MRPVAKSSASRLRNRMPCTKTISPAPALVRQEAFAWSSPERLVRHRPVSDRVACSSSSAYNVTRAFVSVFSVQCALRAAQRLASHSGAAGVAPRGVVHLGHTLASAPSGRAGPPQPQREGARWHGTGGRTRLPSIAVSSIETARLPPPLNFWSCAADPGHCRIFLDLECFVCTIVLYF
jgi:hypothetical protein